MNTGSKSNDDIRRELLDGIVNLTEEPTLTHQRVSMSLSLRIG
jgi:hypothetical protein